MVIRQHNKTRTGCVICKERRVKCGEEKPSCLKCQRFGRSCEYRPPKAWVFELPKHKTTTVSRLPFHTAPAEEKRAFLFFTERTAELLSPFTPITENFFHKVVPKFCLNSRAVWHIMVATSTRHELETCAPENIPHLAQLARRQYSESIAELVKPGQTPDVETILLSSCLFLACDSFCELSSSSQAALVHLSSALRILREQGESKRRSEAGTNVITQHIVPILGQFELLMSMFNTPRQVLLPAADSSTSTPLLEKAPILPASFPDLLTAQHYLVRLCRWRFTCCLGPSPPCPEKIHSWTQSSPCFTNFMTLFKRWADILTAHCNALERADRYRALVAVRRYRLLYLAMTYSAPLEEDGFEHIPKPDLHRVRPLTVDLSTPDSLRIGIPLPTTQQVENVQNTPVSQSWNVSAITTAPSPAFENSDCSNHNIPSTTDVPTTTPNGAKLKTYHGIKVTPLTEQSPAMEWPKPTIPPTVSQTLDTSNAYVSSHRKHSNTPFDYDFDDGRDRPGCPAPSNDQYGKMETEASTTVWFEMKSALTR